MKLDLDNIVANFDSIMPLSDIEVGYYRLGYNRNDGKSVLLSFMIHELAASVIVIEGNVAISAFHTRSCYQINVLSPGSGCIELLCRNKMRCFIALESESIVDVEEFDTLQ